MPERRDREGKGYPTTQVRGNESLKQCEGKGDEIEGADERDTKI